MQTSGIGDGEKKFAAEFNSSVEGQNCTYDVCIKFNDEYLHVDVKKPDKDNSFRLGIKCIKQVSKVLLKYINLYCKTNG